MIVRNEVLRTFKIITVILAAIIYGTGIVFRVKNIEVETCFRVCYWIMVALSTLYLVIAFWPKSIVNKWFDRYYNTLSDAEKERFEKEVESVKRTRYFLTSKEVVQRGLVITPISEIASVQYSESVLRTRYYAERNRVVRLKDASGKFHPPVNVRNREKGEALIKAIMERNPEIIASYGNTQIAILRSGKAKKTDEPIPDDLAPISGTAKREKNEEQLHLAPIRFRSEEEAVPQTQEAPEQPAAESQPRHNRNRRRGHKLPVQKQEQAPQQQKPAQAQAEGDQPKPHRRNRNRRRPNKNANKTQE